MLMMSDRSRFQRCSTDDAGSLLPENGTRPLNILIVEDEFETQRMIGLIMRRSGHHLTFCANGEEAMQCIKAQQFDMVFMDVLMPFMDGLEATRLIRKWENGKSHLPVIGITAIFGTEYRKCFQAGMDDLISKPFEIGQIHRMIAKYGSPTKPTHQPSTVVPDPISEKDAQILNRADAVKRLGDEETYNDILGEFIQGLPGRYEELLKDLEADELKKLANHAHNLKGLAASMGAEQLSLAAREIEQFINENHRQLEEKLRKVHDRIQDLRFFGQEQ